VVDGDRFVLGESDRVADNGFAFRDRSNSRDVIVLLQRVDDRLHGRDIGVHLCAQLFERG